MHRIDGYGHNANTFTEGDPANAVPATVVTDDWLNAVQEELCGAAEAAGIVLSKPSNTQLAGLANILRVGAAAPVAGTYARGALLWNSAPEAGGNLGWICVAAGTPGTWLPFGVISFEA